MENNDQGGIKRSNEKPLRIKKLISVEDGSAICEKKWKQTAICDPDNTKQTSNGSPSRRIKDAICLTDPEQRKGEKKNVGERVSYEQNKENQSRKQYSLRSKAKTQKEESDIRSSAISRMSSRNSASTMETNGISMCAKPVSPDRKLLLDKLVIIMVIKLLIITWIVLVINQLISTWIVLVTKQLITT